jgi:hypothetical protein
MGASLRLTRMMLPYPLHNSWIISFSNKEEAPVFWRINDFRELFIEFSQRNRIPCETQDNMSLLQNGLISIVFQLREDFVLGRKGEVRCSRFKSNSRSHSRSFLMSIYGFELNIWFG